MNITLRQMQYFVTLAAQRNFRRAAEVVNISQPALSIQIKEMEDRLGGQLVERQARDVIVTSFGQMILAHCKSILQATHEMEQQAKLYGGRTARLSIGMIPTIAPYVLPNVLADLRSQDVALDVQIYEAKTESLIADLRSGDLDAAVMALPSLCDDLHDEFLFEDRLLLAGTQSRLSRYPQNLPASEMSQGQLLLLEDGNCLTDQTLDICGRTRAHPQINMGASSMATLTRMVAAGFGVTLVPELAAVGERAAAGGLELRRFDGVEPARRIGLVRRTSTPAGQWFSTLAALIQDAGTCVIRECRSQI
jgi:LysR family hydrogen peroxide-inducible transcriptional activator